MTTSLIEAIDREVKRIAAELYTFPYEPHTWTESHGRDGNAGGGHWHVVPGCAGAAVYHDILAEGARGTRGDVLLALDRSMVGGWLTKAEQARLEAARAVARLRLLSPRSVSAAVLPPDTGDYYQPARIKPRQRIERVDDARALGSKVVRYLKAHAKKPYGPRGEQIIAETAMAAWRAAILEEAA